MTRLQAFLNQLDAYVRAQGSSPDVQKAATAAAQGLGIKLDAARLVHSAEEILHLAKALAPVVAPDAPKPDAPKPDAPKPDASLVEP